MNKLLLVSTFIFGAAIGSFATYKALKDRYEQITQEEINSIKEDYRKAKQELINKDINAQKEVAKKSLDKPDIKEYTKTIEKLKYSNYFKSNNSNNLTEGPDPKDMSDPYVIDPEEYGEDETYDQITLTYYSDGVLADENVEEVENVDGIIGLDSLDSFGQYESDAVHVKNDRTRTYYEILRDERNYQDIVAGRPDPTDFYE